LIEPEWDHQSGAPEEGRTTRLLSWMTAGRWLHAVSAKKKLGSRRCGAEGGCVGSLLDALTPTKFAPHSKHHFWAEAKETPGRDGRG
jgi:hypothetical protein